MGVVKFAVSNVANSVAQAFYISKAGRNLDTYSQVTTALNEAFSDCAANYKKAVRAHIRSRGFSGNWANAWRTEKYPQKGNAISPAVFGWHKIPYSDVFESGAVIRGKRGLLWIPLPAIRAGYKKRMTPAKLKARGVKLFTIKGKRHPLLAASVRMTDALAQTYRARTSTGGKMFSIAKLAKGGKGKRGKVVTVPLFFGVTTVTIKKRLDVAAETAKARDKIGEYYFQRIGVQ